MSMLSSVPIFPCKTGPILLQSPWGVSINFCKKWIMIAHQVRCNARFSGLPLHIVSYRLTALNLRDNYYISSEGSNTHSLISQCN